MKYLERVISVSYFIIYFFCSLAKGHKTYHPWILLLSKSSVILLPHPMVIFNLFTLYVKQHLTECITFNFLNIVFIYPIAYYSFLTFILLLASSSCFILLDPLHPPQLFYISEKPRAQCWISLLAKLFLYSFFVSMAFHFIYFWRLKSIVWTSTKNLEFWSNPAYISKFSEGSISIWAADLKCVWLIGSGFILRY